MKENFDIHVSTCFHSSSSILKQPHQCAFGPASRHLYVLTYITKGKGYYEVADKKYKLEKGDSFLIYPGTVVHYYPDENDPWEYMWAEFSGDEVTEILSYTSLNSNNPTVHAAKGNIYKYFTLLCNEHENLENTDYSVNKFLKKSAFYKLISEYIKVYPKEISQEVELKNLIIEYVYQKFCDPSFSVKDIENRFSMTHAALYDFFNENFKTTPKKFINDLRIKKACSLLHRNDLSVKSVALSSGFKDPLYFSKVFKEKTNFSPSEYFEKVILPRLPSIYADNQNKEENEN